MNESRHFDRKTIEKFCYKTQKKIFNVVVEKQAL